METNLRRLISLRESDALLQTQIARVQAEEQALVQNGLDLPRPYPITLLDQLQYQLTLAEEELASQLSALASTKADGKMQAALLVDRQAFRRRLLEKSGNDLDLDREREVENASMAVQAAETGVELAQAEVKNAELAKDLAEKRHGLLLRKVELVKAHFQFSKSILDEQLASLEARRVELTAEHLKVQEAATVALERVKALEAAAKDDPVSLAELDAMTEWLTTFQRRKILKEQALELNLIKRDLWERRFGLSRGEAVTSLSDWEESTRGIMRRLDSGRKTINAQLSQLRNQLATVVESAPDGDGPVEQWRKTQAKALAAHQSYLETALSDYDDTYVLAQRLLSEIKASRKNLSWSERANRAWAALLDFWRIELYTIGDSSVTVGKMLGALLVLLVGLTIAGSTTNFISRRLLAHLPVTDSARVNIERGMRYFFILLVFLFALRVVNIPLTIFTFLGGSLAIAVGFGAQNILNNFISGLILMAERPIRVGDLIEVDGTTGVVEEIGARSTRVGLATGIHVILPNSVLLENKVINWTLTDQTVRTSVSVGVAYGSDTQLVMELISRATLSVETIEKTPDHFVVLEDLGDSALKFTVHFWVSIVAPLNKRLSESNLRLAIASLFQENGISIPFPHRDLTVTQPVAVQIMGAQAKKESHEH
jgi:small-conductance mechanosensitive channel